MTNNFHKKIGIIYDANNTKPLFIVDIVATKVEYNSTETIVWRVNTSI